MIHRSSSSRRRKPPRTGGVSPHRSTGSLSRKPSSTTAVTFDDRPVTATSPPSPEHRRGNIETGKDEEAYRYRKSSLGSKVGNVRSTSPTTNTAGSVAAITAEYVSAFRGSITVTDADDQHGRSFPIYSPDFNTDDDNGNSNNNNNNSPFLNSGKEDYSRSPRGSVSYDTLRSRGSQGSVDIASQKSGHAVSMFTRKISRASLAPDQIVAGVGTSPRNSLIPEDVYNRNARGSIDPGQLSRSSRSSLLPDEAENFSRSARPSLIADVGTMRNSGPANNLYPESSSQRSPRNSLIPEKGDNALTRSSRNSLYPEVSKSPRTSLVAETNKSPRSSLIPDTLKTSRASIVGDSFSSGRTPRGSVASEGALYVHSRSSRSSLPFQDCSVASVVQGKSPRGSIVSNAGVQFDLTTRTTPRGSIESAPPMGPKDRDQNERAISPYRAGSLRAGSRNVNAKVGGSTGITTIDVENPRRTSSNVSQVGVSSDDRKHLCEHTKLKEDTNVALTDYGSFMYQLNHANMESSGVCDFIFRALHIIYRTALVTAILASLLVLPIVMLIMGIEFAKDCPKEPNIPVYMIVGGCFGIIGVCWVMWHQVRSLRYELAHPKSSSSQAAEDDDAFVTTSFGTKMACIGLSTFLIVWFALGNHWIYRIYWPAFEQPSIYQPDSWCHKSLYIFALIHLYIIYGVIAVILLVTVVLATFQICFLKCR